MAQIPLRNSAFQLDAFDADLTDSRFEDCLLAGARFKYASFEGAAFELVRWDRTQMKNVSFDGASLERVSLVNCAIRHGRYAGFTIDGIPVETLLAHYRAQTAVESA